MNGAASASRVAGCTRNNLTTVTKNTGTKKIARMVADSMPPTTTVPMAFCPPEPQRHRTGALVYRYFREL